MVVRCRRVCANGALTLLYLAKTQRSDAWTTLPKRVVYLGWLNDMRSIEQRTKSAMLPLYLSKTAVGRCKTSHRIIPHCASSMPPGLLDLCLFTYSIYGIRLRARLVLRPSLWASARFWPFRTINTVHCNALNHHPPPPDATVKHTKLFTLNTPPAVYIPFRVTFNPNALAQALRLAAWCGGRCGWWKRCWWFSSCSSVRRLPRGGSVSRVNVSVFYKTYNDDDPKKWVTCDNIARAPTTLCVAALLSCVGLSILSFIWTSI